MLVFLRTPIGRWVAFSFLLPLLATGLGALGRFLQRRSGRPTRISKVLLSVSTFVDKRLNRAQPESALAR